MNAIRNHKRNIFRALFMLILVGAAWFFYEELSRHWESLRLEELRLRTGGILIALGLVVAAYSLAAVVWHYGINAHPSSGRMSLKESYAVFNTTQMTKYLPGKVWSYALQMILMQHKGVSISYLLYLNMLIISSLIFSASLFGTLFVAAYSNRIPRVFSIPFSLVMFAAYLGFTFLNGRVFKAVVGLVNRVFGREIVCFELPLPFLLRMQAGLIGSNVLFGFAGYALCYGIGFDIPAEMVFPVSAATLLADTVGFVMFFSPGGLGIREGALFFLLDGVTGKRLAILLPLALRIITMSSDLILGLTGLTLLRHCVGKSEHNIGNRHA
ncbi:MAG: hypothetical protein ACE144_14055 [Thermodesulfobacteriota bacterium]